MTPPKHLNEKNKSDATKFQVSGTEAPNVADALSINLSTVYIMFQEKENQRGTDRKKGFDKSIIVEISL